MSDAASGPRLTASKPMLLIKTVDTSRVLLALLCFSIPSGFEQFSKYEGAEKGEKWKPDTLSDLIVSASAGFWAEAAAGALHSGKLYN